MDVYASDFLLASISIVLLCSINELIGMFVVDAMCTLYSITCKKTAVRKQVVRQKDGFASSATNSQPSEPMEKETGQSQKSYDDAFCSFPSYCCIGSIDLKCVCS
jgi:hypothetical protein